MVDYRYLDDISSLVLSVDPIVTAISQWENHSLYKINDLKQ